MKPRLPFGVPLALLTFALLLLSPRECFSPFQGFLKIAGVQGVSTNPKHTGEIEILSFHQGVSQAITGTVSSVGNIAGQRATFDALTITKRLDKASPLLAQNCAEGKVYPSAVLAFSQPGGAMETFMEITLTNALVSSIHQGGSVNGADDAPVEEVGFSFTKIDWTYTIILADGKPGGRVSGSWDLAKNTK